MSRTITGILLFILSLSLSCSSKDTKEVPISSESKTSQNSGVNPFRNNPEAIEEGRNQFMQFCAACHGREAKGLIGPDLTDSTWLHGNTDQMVFENISHGIPIENMKLNRGPCPPHKNSLGSEKIHKIVAWIASINPDLTSQ